MKDNDFESSLTFGTLVHRKEPMTMEQFIVALAHEMTHRWMNEKYSGLGGATAYAEMMSDLGGLATLDEISTRLKSKGRRASAQRFNQAVVSYTKDVDLRFSRAALNELIDPWDEHQGAQLVLLSLD